MKLIRKVQKKTNGYLLSIPADLLDQAKINGGDYVILKVENDMITIKKVKIEEN